MFDKVQERYDLENKFDSENKYSFPIHVIYSVIQSDGNIFYDMTALTWHLGMKTPF